MARKGHWPHFRRVFKREWQPYTQCMRGFANAEKTVLLWNAAEIVSKRYNRDEICKWIVQQSNDISSHKQEIVVSLSSDTCPVMISAATKLGKVPGFSHVEWVPCDSHGLQLLIKDICELPTCKKTLKSATKWIEAFSKAPKQLHILRTHQRMRYKCIKALITSVITRWGTQVSIALFYRDLRFRANHIYIGECTPKRLIAERLSAPTPSILMPILEISSISMSYWTSPSGNESRIF